MTRTEPSSRRFPPAVLLASPVTVIASMLAHEMGARPAFDGAALATAVSYIALGALGFYTYVALAEWLFVTTVERTGIALIALTYDVLVARDAAEIARRNSEPPPLR